jgi:hypothetical protein
VTPVSHLISELIHELLVELHNPACPVCARGEEGSSEVQCALFLAKARTSNHADTCCVEEAEAVELVGLAALLLRCLDGLLGKCDGWEEVHGALLH